MPNASYAASQPPIGSVASLTDAARLPARSTGSVPEICAGGGGAGTSTTGKGAAAVVVGPLEVGGTELEPVPTGAVSVLIAVEEWTAVVPPEHPTINAALTSTPTHRPNR